MARNFKWKLVEEIRSNDPCSESFIRLLSQFGCHTTVKDVYTKKELRKTRNIIMGKITVIFSLSSPVMSVGKFYFIEVLRDGEFGFEYPAFLVMNLAQEMSETNINNGDFIAMRGASIEPESIRAMADSESLQVLVGTRKKDVKVWFMKCEKNHSRNYTSLASSFISGYEYKKISQLVKEQKHVNVYGVVISIVKPPTETKTHHLHAIISIVDETCVNGEKFMVHVFYVKSCEEPLLETQSVIRLHRMKVEKYKDFFDGRVFSSHDIVTFCRDDKSFKMITTATSCTYTDSDSKRVEELLKWYDIYSTSLQRVAEVSVQTDQNESVLGVVQRDNTHKSATTDMDPTVQANNENQEISINKSFPSRSSTYVQTSIEAEDIAALLNSTSVQNELETSMHIESDVGQEVPTVQIKDITKQGIYHLICKVLSVSEEPGGKFYLTVTDGTRCATYGNKLAIDVYITNLTKALQQLKRNQVIGISYIRAKECTPNTLEFGINGHTVNVNLFPDESCEARRIETQLMMMFTENVPNKEVDDVPSNSMLFKENNSSKKNCRMKKFKCSANKQVHLLDTEIQLNASSIIDSNFPQTSNSCFTENTLETNSTSVANVLDACVKPQGWKRKSHLQHDEPCDESAIRAKRVSKLPTINEEIGYNSTPLGDSSPSPSMLIDISLSPVKEIRPNISRGHAAGLSDAILSKESNKYSVIAELEKMRHEHCILARIKDVHPPLSAPYTDVVSGMCGKCSRIALYSKIEKTLKSGELLCPVCSNTDIHVPLILKFMLTLEVSDTNGETLSVLFSSDRGGLLFDCSANDFIKTSLVYQRQAIQKLKKMINSKQMFDISIFPLANTSSTKYMVLNINKT